MDGRRFARYGGEISPSWMKSLGIVFAHIGGIYLAAATRAASEQNVIVDIRSCIGYELIRHVVGQARGHNDANPSARDLSVREDSLCLHR